MSDSVEVVEERLSSKDADLMGGKFPSVTLKRGKSNGWLWSLLITIPADAAENE